MAADVNAAVQAAIGGMAATQIMEGDRRFDFVIRYRPEFRGPPEAIRNIFLPTPDGNHIPLGQVADVSLRPGAFMIYREGGRRYIPVKFSIRGRDLASTFTEVENKLAQRVRLPEGYHYEWAGEYESLKREERRLAIVIPFSVGIIFALLYTLFNSIRAALIVLATLPFGAVGGVLALFAWGTPFSISAAVGFVSAMGVATLGSSVFLSGIRRHYEGEVPKEEAIRKGALVEMRPILLACLSASVGLLPAAISTGIGAQAQQPLARVVVGAMITSPFAILFVMPFLAAFWLP
jgi:cobalt-zinc-cadmium resistance protein CzcA